MRCMLMRCNEEKRRHAPPDAGRAAGIPTLRVGGKIEVRHMEPRA